MTTMARVQDGLRSVATTSERDALYPVPQDGQKVFVRDTAEVYEFQSVGGWAVILSAGTYAATRVLYSAAAPSTNATVETTIAEYLVPSNTLDATGEQLRIDGVLKIVAPGGESWTAKVTYGLGDTAVITVSGTGSTVRRFTMTIARTGASAQVITYQIFGTSYATPVSTTGTEVLAIAQPIKVRGNVSSGAAASITVDVLTVELLAAA